MSPPFDKGGRENSPRHTHVSPLLQRGGAGGVVQGAPRKLGGSLESLAVEDGTIRARGGGSITYWQLAPEVDLARDATGQVRPKETEELRPLGAALPRLDIPAKVSGAAFLHDLELPGMLHGRVVRPPSYHARVGA